MSVTPDQVEAAYQALATGDRDKIAAYWAQDMRWLVPGNHQLAGWWEGLDGFLDFMGRVGKLTDNSFSMTRTAILTGGDWSADVSHNEGARESASATPTSPYEWLAIDVVHVLRWRDGQVFEGKGAIFGDGTTQFNQFWSQLDPTGLRI